MATINITGTGGIIEGNLGSANVNVNLDTARNFNGVDDNITVANHATIQNLETFTYSFWVKFNSLGRQNLIYKGTNIQLELTASNFIEAFRRYNTTNDRATTNKTTFAAGSWYHIAWVGSSDGSTAPKIYVNGNEETYSTQTSGTGSSTDDSGASLEIGRAAIDTDIADFRIYNTGLSAANVAILASKIRTDTSLTGGTSNLKLWHKLDGTEAAGSGNVPDDSPQSNTGTLTGTQVDYDAYSVDVYDNSTTTDGSFTITQGKVEGLALSSALFDGSGDIINVGDSNAIITGTDVTYACWVKVDNGYANTVYLIANQKGAGSTNMSLAVNRDASGNSAGKIDGFVWNGSSHIHTVYDAGINDGKWHHIVFTTTGSSQVLYFDGVQVATGSGAFSNAASTDDMSIGAFNAASPSDSLDGNMRDVRVYDYALSAERAASLYSNTYPQTPDHWWKMDEGTGSTANDVGTGTTANGTLNGNAALSDSNGTLDLDYDLVIAANGTLSAPRGTVSLVRNFQNSGTFTHNNGTFEAAQGDNTFINTTATVDPVFYNVTHIGDQIRFYENTTIENSFVTASSAKVYIWTNRTLTMGTATSAGTLTVNVPEFIFYAYNSGHTAKLAGASSLYPIVITGSDNFTFGSNSGGQGIAQVENVDFQLDISTVANEYLQLTGDAEFDAFTVTNGTLDLNGQRAEFSGLLDIDGTIDAENSIIYASNIDYDGVSWDGNTTTKMVITGTGTDDFSNEVFDTIFYNNTHTIGNWCKPTNLIIGGSVDIGGSNRDPSVTDLTIATGGALSPVARTLTVAGDFTTSGGLIGKSALETVASSSESASTSSNYTVLDNQASCTIEFWLKLTDISNTTARILNTNSSGSGEAYYVRTDGSSLQFHLGCATTDATFSNSDTSLLTLSNLGTKFHHYALVKDNDTVSLYIDGKKAAEKTTSGNTQSANSALFLGQFRGGDSNFADMVMDELRFYTDARTESEIRSNMFTDSPSGDNLVGHYKFDEGTGTTVADSSSNSNALTLTSSGAFAGAGTFTYGTSTLNMTGDGTMNIPAGFDVYNLTGGASSKTTTIALPSNGSDLDVYGTLTVDGGTLTDTNNADVIIRGTAPPVVNGSSTLENLWRIQNISNMTLPATTYNILLVTSSSTCTSGGNMTFNSELDVASGSTFNANGNTITCAFLDVSAGATVDLRNSTYLGTTVGDLNRFDFFHANSTTSLLTGNTTITGTTSPLTQAFFPSGANLEIVGDLSNMQIRDEGDITVIGSVVNCTLEDDKCNIRQFFHTLDTQQLLDADSAGDDDLRLEKPALDNANELQTG